MPGTGGVPVALGVEVSGDVARVVENAVQHDTHTEGVGLAAQAGEVLFGAQHGVYFFVVGGAVTVVLRGFKDGAEVDGLHPQALQIG